MTEKAQATSYEEYIGNDECLIAALLHVYGHQTPDEQSRKETKYLNNVGFNGVDVKILTSFSQFYIDRGFLTPKQLQSCRRMMKKYHAQVPWEALEPRPIKGREKNKEEKPKKQDKTVRFAGGMLNIEFPYDLETIDKIKTIPGRRFDKVNKRWTAPPSYEAMEFLQQEGFVFDKILQEKWEEVDSGQGSARAKETTIDLSRLKHKPYPFQEKGIAFIEGKKGRALVGDDMGLGKTIQAIGYASMHPEFHKIIVVCTASSKYNWQREIEKWTGEKAIVLSGILHPSMSMEFENRWLIINYDILGLKSSNEIEKEIDDITGKRKWSPSGTWSEALVKIKPDLIVLDETQKIKNDKAIRSKAALHICSNIQHVIGLTGTPIKNRPIEIFTLIKAINKHIFPSKRTFGEKFCGLTYNGWGWDYSGATNLDELHRILCNTIMIRRKKEEVLPELPPKVRTVVPLDITNRSEYERAEDDLIAYIRSLKGDTAAANASRAEHLVRFENLKQIAVKGKINACVEWIHDFLETENKIVTFSIHKFTREILKKDFNKEYVLLDGSVSAIDRQKAVDAFQNNEAIKVFIGDLIAAGEAITLTAASSTCFLELGWTPGDHDQAEDRVHRIGQKADSINAYYLIARNTIEEKLCAMIDQKRQVISQAIDGKKAEDIDLLTELIKFYGGE